MLGQILLEIICQFYRSTLLLTSVQFIAAIDFGAIDFSRPSLECGEVKVKEDLLFCERAEPLDPTVVNSSMKWIL